MLKEKYYKNEIDDLENYLTLVEAYEEIAATRMRRVKKTVLTRRAFMEDLNEAFAYAMYAYNVFKGEVGGHSTANTNSLFNTNGKSVSILLASNSRLYGDVIKNTYRLFEKDIEKSNTDIVIIGKIGKALFEESSVTRDYKFFDISDIGIDEKDLKSAVTYINKYSNIIVYHGVFKSILVQEPTRTFVTGEVLKIEKSIEGREKNFLFEPSVEEVAEYFEKQILELIFEQTLFESSLSKFSSRMISLDMSADKIGKNLESLNFNLKKAKHKSLNRNIQAVLSGESLWK